MNKHNNKLIGDFMEIKVDNFRIDRHTKGHNVFNNPSIAHLSFGLLGAWGTEELAMGEFYEKARYSESWDWLMPVIEKIERSGKYCLKIKSSPTISGRWFVHTVTIFENTFSGLEKPLIEIQSDYDNNESKLSTCYRFVVEFIKWHNQAT